MATMINGGVFCMDDDVMGAGMWWMMDIGSFWLVVLIGVIAIIIWALTRASGVARSDGRNPPPNGVASLSILRERFARGEITETEFRTRRQILEEPPQSDRET